MVAACQQGQTWARAQARPRPRPWESNSAGWVGTWAQLSCGHDVGGNVESRNAQVSGAPEGSDTTGGTGLRLGLGGLGLGGRSDRPGTGETTLGPGGQGQNPS